MGHNDKKVNKKDRVSRYTCKQWERHPRSLQGTGV